MTDGVTLLQTDLAAGKSLGIITIDDLDKPTLAALLSRLSGRGCRYGLLKANGRWLMVRHARLADLKAIGSDFNRASIVHVPEGGKKPALRHDLQTGDHVVLGPGAKVLEDLNICELMIPPGGPLNRHWRLYGP